MGAGELGGVLAHLLARRDLAATLRIVDANRQVGAGKALDIMQAAPLERFSTSVSAIDDVYAAAGADVLVVADRAGGGEWQGEEGLMLLEKIVALGGARTIVCAGAAQRELVERGVRELGIARHRIIGSAPEALAAAVRAMVALEANRSARDIALTVLGVPPHHTVVPWEEATIGGLAATRLLDEAARRRVAARVAPLWPPGPIALAAAAVKIVAAILQETVCLASCFVAPDDSAGIRSRAAALPVLLGRNGSVSAVVPSLNVHDRVRLDNAIML